MTTERRKADRRVSPALGDFALQERGELLVRIAEQDREIARLMTKESNDVQGGEREAPIYQFQWREIGESDWSPCDFCWYQYCSKSPEHDTRVVEAVAQHSRIVAAKEAEIEAIKENAADALDDLHRELSALKAKPAVNSDVITHSFSRDRNIGWNASEEEQAFRAAFETWLKTSQFSRPNSPWDIWKACAKAITAQQCASVAVPAVATLDMKNAGWREIERQGIDPESCEMQSIYHAMIAAAPSPAGLSPVAGGVVVPRNIAERMAIDASQYDHEHAIVNDNVQLWQQPNARLSLTVGDLRMVRALLAQQPAPSPVSGLVDAMRAIQRLPADDEFAEQVIERIDAALAAYKAQGGDV